ncbi:MAG: beta-lactamase family protein [Gammaproteobacteria bacterium]|nr:beta-lactamase family protein [Gammaproteobacteria bacterium]
MINILWISGILLLIACAYQPVTRTDNLQTRVDSIREQYQLPGISVAYVLSDGSSTTITSGVANIETKKAMTDKTRLLGASTGKSFVAALTLAFVQESRLTLDDPVSKWLGKYAWFDRVPNHESITVRHLLTHSAGLPDHVHMKKFHDAFAKEKNTLEPSFPPVRLIGFILDEAPLFAAGHGWAYSDTGYLLLGMVLEEASEKPYYVEIRERFLIPLQLRDTTSADRRDLKNLAAGYMNSANPFGLPAKTLDKHGQLHWHPAIEWTGGGLATTAHDLAHWGSALFTGRAMSGEYLPELLTGVAIQPNAADIRYAAGIVVASDPRFGPVYGHSGWIPGYVSSFRYYPKYGVTIAFQINTDQRIIDSDDNAVKAIEDSLIQAVAQTD